MFKVLPNPSTRSFILKSICSGILRSFRYNLNISTRLKLKKQFYFLSKEIKSKYCIIIAGGPSFNPSFSSILERHKENIDIFTINHYYKSEFSNCIVPDFYVISDPEQVHPTSAQMKRNNEELKQYITTHGIRLFTPYQSSWKAEYSESLSFCDVENLYSPNINPSSPRGYTSNTALKALAIALTLPYEDIYLIGLDYDYLGNLSIHRDGRIHYSSSHHYASNNCDVDWSSDFSSLSHLCSFFAFEYKSIDKLKSHRVLNLSDRSLIDTFQKVPFSVFDSRLTAIK